MGREVWDGRDRKGRMKMEGWKDGRNGKGGIE